MSFAPNQARYDNYRLYRVHLKTEEHVNVFKELEDVSDSYTFYGHARHTDQNLTLMVAADKIAAFSDLLKRFKITSNLLVSRNFFFNLSFSL